MGLEKCFCGGTFESHDEIQGHADFQSVDANYTRYYMECDSCHNQYMTPEQIKESKVNLDEAMAEDGNRDHETEAVATIERYTSRGGVIPSRYRDNKNQILARMIDQHEFRQMFVKPDEGAEVRIVLSDYMDSLVFDMDLTVQKEMIELLQKNVALYQ